MMLAYVVDCKRETVSLENYNFFFNGYAFPLFEREPFSSKAISKSVLCPKIDSISV